MKAPNCSKNVGRFPRVNPFFSPTNCARSFICDVNLLLYIYSYEIKFDLSPTTILPKKLDEAIRTAA